MGGKVILEMEEVTIKVEQGMQPASQKSLFHLFSKQETCTMCLRTYFSNK